MLYQARIYQHVHSNLTLEKVYPKPLFMEWVAHKHVNSTFVGCIIVRCPFHELAYRIIFIALMAGPIILRYKVINSQEIGDKVYKHDTK